MTEAKNPEANLRDYSDVEYVFEPHDNSMPNAREYFQSIWDRRDFIKANARAELQSPHSGTILGQAWQVVDPLFQALIYWFLFTAIRGKSSASFFLIVVSGVFFFNFTMVALGEGGRSIQRSKGLVLNSTFPLATLPISVIYRGFLQFLPTIGVYALFHLAFGGAIGPGLLMLPFLLILQILISTGLSLVFATLTVYVADMSNLLNYVLRVLLFITPVIYPVAQLQKAPAAIQAFLYLNPFFALFSAYQYVFTGLVPTLSQIVQILFWAVFWPIVGFRFFVSRERGFAMRL
ncbi:MAG: ABC transporter permease [Aquihabitans sp.]